MPLAEGGCHKRGGETYIFYCVVMDLIVYKLVLID